jgi:hypothetical protein
MLFESELSTCLMFLTDCNNSCALSCSTYELVCFRIAKLFKLSVAGWATPRSHYFDEVT